MYRRITMNCPNCGVPVGGVAQNVGIVKLIKFKCACGREWKHKEIRVSFDALVLTAEFERLHLRYPEDKPEGVKSALSFLSAKIDELRYAQLDKAAALRKKREDHWEKKFLKEALGGLDYE